MKKYKINYHSILKNYLYNILVWACLFVFFADSVEEYLFYFVVFILVSIIADLIFRKLKVLVFSFEITPTNLVIEYQSYFRFITKKIDYNELELIIAKNYVSRATIDVLGIYDNDKKVFILNLEGEGWNKDTIDSIYADVREISVASILIDSKEPFWYFKTD